MNRNDHQFKVVLIGNSNGGKTSLSKKFATGKFDNSENLTIGASFLNKKLRISGKDVILDIWDTAGQERFCSLAKLYYRDADAIIIVYDITLESPISQLKKWRYEIHKKAPKNALLCVVGNKEDLVEQNYDTREVRKYAFSFGSMYMHTSAATNRGVDKLFNEIGKKLLINQKIIGKKNSISLSSSVYPKYKKNCCQ